MGDVPQGGGRIQREPVERRSCRGQSLPLGPVQDLGYLACSCVSLGPHTALRLFFKNVLPIYKNREFFCFFNPDF